MKKITLVFMFLILFGIVSSADTKSKKKEQVDVFSNISETYDGTGRPYALDYYWDFPYGPLYEQAAEEGYGETYYTYDRFYGSEVRRKKSYQELNNLVSLEQKKTQVKLVQKEISGVRVLQAKFYKQYTPDTVPISIAEITVENKSSTPIITVFCRGRLISHKTGEVIFEGTFKYDMPKELPSGTKETYEIDLNSFGQWAKVRVPDLTKFEVDIVGIETNKGKVLVAEFSKEDKAKLQKLRKKYIY
ncbi:MAG: hypothetical protein LBD57_01735 [Endomicrobium sp.]|jgi:hypothetical protein|uniref:hypothetical protein n=1 Tax=Candidatus Endomicrobiellum cubanum TaxID=3242325 RepID=UPI002824BFE2|nr:hypothetical protein [Endomicrobium sp.]